MPASQLGGQQDDQAQNKKIQQRGRLDMVAHTCNFITQEDEGGLRV